MRAIFFTTCFLLSACSAAPEKLHKNPIVILDTTSGPIEITVYPDKAPISAADFLRYVDGGLYDAQGFYRTVHAGNDPRDMGMSLIQGGRLDKEVVGAPIAHELTTQSGISNRDGAVAIARDKPGTGSATYFFINIGNNDFLDTGGIRNPDGQGYATFARVTSGMDVVRAIQTMETIPDTDPVIPNQTLIEPVIIKRAYRK